MMLNAVRDDIAVVFKRDPAVRSTLEVILCYPGFHARLLHRLASPLWTMGLKLPARWISQVGRWLTGIEIHPGARIGERFFIDHGMGVVIGETAVLGDDITLYQGVTLGGVSPDKGPDHPANAGRRHPLLEDGVVVGCGASILGGITVGACARVGANAVVVKDVRSGATMVGTTAREAGVRPAPTEPVFPSYGTPSDLRGDPLEQRVQLLHQRIEELQKKLHALENASSKCPPDRKAC